MSDWDEESEESEELDDGAEPDDLPDDGGLDYGDPFSASAQLRGLIEVHKWPQRLKWNLRMMAAFTLLPFEGPLGRIDGWLRERKRQQAQKRREEKEERHAFMKELDERSESYDYLMKEPDEQEKIFKEWQRARQQGSEPSFGDEEWDDADPEGEEDAEDDLESED